MRKKSLRNSETEEQRQRRLEKGVNMTEKGVNMKQKHRELETFADKESRLLTRRVHRIKGETALQRESQLQIMREYQREQIQNKTPEV